MWFQAQDTQPYRPVHHDDENITTKSRLETSEYRDRIQRLRLINVVLSTLAIIVCAAWSIRELQLHRVTETSIIDTLGMLPNRLINQHSPEVYSPALEAIEYEEVVFHNNFHNDTTPWQGPPTDEVDKAWDRLYRGVGVIKVPGSVAARLPNSTLPIPGEADGFIIGIEVYHQLHCLDIIRRAMYPDRYGGDKDLSPKAKLEYWIHVDHCIDNLRQVVMCYSDTTTIPWKVNERLQAEFPDAHTTHVCRNHGKLTEWMLHPDRHFPQEKYQLRVDALHKGSG